MYQVFQGIDEAVFSILQHGRYFVLCPIRTPLFISVIVNEKTDFQ